MSFNCYHKWHCRNSNLIKSSSSEKLLGVDIGSKFNFDSHVNHSCDKASKKLRALAWVTSYVTLQKKKIVITSFFNAKFNYCPLIWILHSPKYNNKIKHLHERCLRLIYNDNKIKHLHERCLQLTYNDKKSSYEILLVKNNSVFTHHKNIQALAIEMFKVK